MHSKKSHKADLELKRPVFFMLGLVISLSIVLSAFQLPVNNDFEANTGGELIWCPFFIPLVEEEAVPNTYREKEKPLTPSITTSDSLFCPEIIIPAIGVSPIKSNEVLNFFEVDKSALPEICVAVNEKEQQLQCLFEFTKKYITQNLVYPKEACYQGKVYVTYIINEYGKISSAKIERGVDEIIDAEVLRVINDLPDLVPASKDGLNVAMKVTLPIAF